MDSVDKSISPKFRAFIAPVCVPNGSEDPAEVMKRSNPLYYNSLQDGSNKSHIKKPGVMNHLIEQGLVSNDGTVIPTKEEQIETNRTMKQTTHQRKVVDNIERQKEARLKRLLKTGRVNEIVFTKEGVFEINPNSRNIKGSGSGWSKVGGTAAGVGGDGGARTRKRKKKRKSQSSNEETPEKPTDKLESTHPSKHKPGSPHPPSDTSKLPSMAENSKSTNTSNLTCITAADASKLPSTSSSKNSSPNTKILQFPLVPSKLSKASMSIKDAISSRDARLHLAAKDAVMEGKRKETSDSRCVNSSKSAQVVTTKRNEPSSHLKLHASHKRSSVGDLHHRKSKKRMVRIRNISSQLAISSSDEDAGAYQVEIISKLPRLVFKASSKNALPKRKSKVMRQEGLLKMQKKTEKNLQNAIERMEKRYDDMCTMGDVSVVRKAPSTSSEKSFRPGTSEMGVQTQQSPPPLEEPNSCDQIEEDMLELLRELVVTPRRHLDSVLMLIGRELSKSEINYNKMLRYVHEYTDIEDYATLSLDENIKNEHLTKVLPNDEFFPKRVGGDPKIGQELQRTSDFTSCTSSPAVASLAKHVVDDFVFDRNVMSASMVNKGIAGTISNKKVEVNNYTIEDGAHSLHQTMSFKQDPYGGTPVSDSYNSIQDFSEPSSVSEQEEINMANFRRTPSTAACHFNRVTGEIYHLYLRKDGTASFSMLSPKEKGVSSFSTYLGSYRENENEKMTLVATPSSLSRRSSIHDIVDLSMYPSSSSLENISCSVDRIPGFNYYKYRRDDGTMFLTTVSPKMWGSSCPHTFIKVYHETKSGMLVPIKTVSTTSLIAEDEKPSEPSLTEGPKLESNSSSSMEAQPSDKSHSCSNMEAGSTDEEEYLNFNETIKAVECRFSRQHGYVYHLYRRSDKTLLLSKMHPEQRDDSMQDTFIGSYIQGEDLTKLTLLDTKKYAPDLEDPLLILDNVEDENISTVEISSPEIGAQNLTDNKEVVLQVEEQDKFCVDEIIIEVNSAPESGLPAAQARKSNC